MRACPAFLIMAKGYEPSDSGKVGDVLKKWPGAASIAGLETATGADMVLSGYDDMPMRTMRLVSEHAQALALQLVQIKLLGDFPSSIARGSLKDSQERMQAFLRECGVPEAKIPAMCVLQPIGYYLPRNDQLWCAELRQGRDEPYVYPQLYDETHVRYPAVKTASQEWGLRGGFVAPTCPSLAGLMAHLDDQEALLIKVRKHPVCSVMPEKLGAQAEMQDVGAGLQALVSPPMPVVIFSRLPGVGAELAYRAHDFYICEMGLTVPEAMMEMASPAGRWFKGWGKVKSAHLARALVFEPKPAQAVDNKDDDNE